MAKVVLFCVIVAVALAVQPTHRPYHTQIAKPQRRLGDSGNDLILQKCLPPTSPSASYQQWIFGSNHEIQLVATGACIDVADYSTDDEAEVYTYLPCHPEV